MDPKKRSTLFTLAVIGGGYAALRGLMTLVPQKLDLRPLETPAGFRTFSAGESSGGFDPLFGLGTPYSAEDAARDDAASARVSADICAALYGDFGGGEQIPLASFSDYYCPYCRIQTKQLSDMEQSNPGDISITWHELPLLGEGSELAAKAALAAKRQGAYVGFHEKLMNALFLASPEYVASLAQDLGVDGAQLIADMESDSVARELENSAALGRLFRFIGTPALVIGRTVVQGQISPKLVREIVELEREEGWSAVCRTA